jgi:hypothetical protein
MGPLGRVPHHPRYYETIRVPATRSTPLPFLRSVVPYSASTSAFHPAPASALADVARGISVRLPAYGRRVYGGGGGSQVPGEPPSACPVLRPRRTAASGLTMRLILPSAFMTASAPRLLITFRGSIAGPTGSLSTLRRADYSVPTQDSLPGGGQPYPGGFVPQGSSGGFQSVCLHTSSHPRLGLAQHEWKSGSNGSKTPSRGYECLEFPITIGNFHSPLEIFHSRMESRGLPHLVVGERAPAAQLRTVTPSRNGFKPA